MGLDLKGSFTTPPLTQWQIRAWALADGNGTAHIDASNNFTSLTDNGTGFSESNLKNILKPYYTTKSKGSGLGLSIVNKIINDHEGTIEFKKQNIGAKIILKLPKNVD